MEHMKFYVQSWKQVEVEEQVELFDSEGNSDTITVPSIEMEDFESTEFAALEDAKSHYDGLDLSEKVGAIYYECAECFDGQHMFKHSSKPDSSYEAKAEEHIAICIAACEAEDELPE